MAITNATLAQKINDLVQQWEDFQLEQQAWMNGVVGGGPNVDGQYPLTDYQGTIVLATCPAQLEDGVAGPAGDAAAAQVAAETAQTAAETAKTAAELAETNADTSEAAAIAAQGLAETAKTAAESARTTAIAQAANTLSDAADTAADLVLTNADVVLTNADVVLTNADVVLTGIDVTAAAASASAAAASAASIDPVLLATLADNEIVTGFYDFTHASGLKVGGTAFLAADIATWNTAYAQQLAGELTVFDNRDGGDVTPDGLTDKRVFFSFTDEIVGSPNNWDSVINVAGWSSTYRTWQLVSNSGADDTNDDLYFRSGRIATWGALRKLWDDSDFTASDFANWNTAYGWGDHAGLYEAIDSDIVKADVAETIVAAWTFSSAITVAATGGGQTLKLKDTGATAALANPYIGFYDDADTRLGYVGFGSTGNSNIYLLSDAGDVYLSAGSGWVISADEHKFLGSNTNPGASASALGVSMLHLNGKETIDAVDTWLRLNQNGDYSAGVFIANALRVDGLLQAYGGITLQDAEDIKWGTATLRCEQETLIDDATGTFDVGNHGLIAIINNYNATAMSVSLVASTQAPVHLNTLGAAVSWGTGSNPDVDGDMNAWKSSATTLSIKNRLGSTRTFSVYTFAPVAI